MLPVQTLTQAKETDVLGKDSRNDSKNVEGDSGRMR